MCCVRAEVSGTPFWRLQEPKMATCVQDDEEDDEDEIKRHDNAACGS